jgi:hypothetical protein
MSGWPYDDRPHPAPETNAPSWQCPDETCACGAVHAEAEEVEFSVMLLSPEGERMSGARVRVFHQDRLLNEDEPNADGSGWITAVVPHAPAMVLLEWAPADTPSDPIYPFRKWYHVDLDRPRREAAQRKLHNLGYSKKKSLGENVALFQLTYGYTQVSGNFEDIEADLASYHDEGRVPLRKLGGRKGGADAGGEEGQSPRLAKLAPGGAGGPGEEAEQAPKKPAPQPPASPPPRKGKRTASQGAAMYPIRFPTAIQAHKANQVFWEFVCIGPFKAKLGDKSGDVEAYFWIFSDALMWAVPRNEEWKNWDESPCPLPTKPAWGRTISNRSRLCRLPCSATDSQAVANEIKVSQAELSRSPPTGGSAPTLPKPTEADAEVKSLLPTAKLFDGMYEKAQVKIGFQYVDDMTRSLEDMSNEYQVKVNKALADKQAKVLAADPKAGPIKLLGTPGKIWAIHEDMEIWAQKGDPPPPVPYVAAVNYGFHKGEATPTVKQGADVWHDESHLDYSQILVLVAGWCLIKMPATDAAPNPAWEWTRTATVYLSQQLCPLVTVTRVPLPRSEYTGQARGDKKNPRKSPPRKPSATTP